MSDTLKPRYISYLRVSTLQQGRSGLGIEAQRKAVTDFLNGGCWELLDEYVETESGRKDERPSLERALAACRIHQATLVVAKVDRLTRSSAFLHQLLAGGVELAFCDLPEVSGPTGKFLLNQMAAIAELEAAMISQRTKAALAAAKARGVKLGCPANATPEGRKKGGQESVKRRREAAAKFKADILPIVMDLREEEGLSLSAVARRLNEQSIKTPRNKDWTAVQVSRILTLN